MAQVVITVNDRNYTITCDDGQENRLKQLAKYLDMHVSRLSGEIGQIGDTRLLLMSALVIADELSESLEHSDQLDGKLKAVAADRDSLATKLQAAENDAASALTTAAERIELLTQRFDGDSVN
ncbi:MAG: cell division protein ZapA [Pseudomonadota bacterium]